MEFKLSIKTHSRYYYVNSLLVSITAMLISFGGNSPHRPAISTTLYSWDLETTPLPILHAGSILRTQYKEKQLQTTVFNLNQTHSPIFCYVPLCIYVMQQFNSTSPTQWLRN